MGNNLLALGIEVDVDRVHSTIAFIQDTKTRATIAVDREIGDMIGVCLEREEWTSPGVRALREVAERYRQECERALDYRSRMDGRD